jgi:hypothetical protein
VVIDNDNFVETPRWGVLEILHNNVSQFTGDVSPIIIINFQASEMIKTSEVVVGHKTPQRGVSTGGSQDIGKPQNPEEGQIQDLSLRKIQNLGKGKAFFLIILPTSAR